MRATLSRRSVLKAGGALVVSLAMPTTAAAQRLADLAGPARKPLDAGEVDAFLAIHRDGSVTIYSGKVDLGQGLRIAIPQMAAEELGVDVARITFVLRDQIPNAVIPVNPLALAITHVRVDQAFR